MAALGANRKKEPQHSTGALGEGTRAISSDTTPEHCSHLGNPLPYFALEGRGTSGVSAGAEPVGLSHSLQHMAGCRHAGERSLYSSALRGSLRCWHSLTRFPAPPLPPQSLFPHHSILQLFFAGTSSCSEDYFHTQLKAKMKWCFKLSRSQPGFI